MTYLIICFLFFIPGLVVVSTSHKRLWLSDVFILAITISLALQLYLSLGLLYFSVFRLRYLCLATALMVLAIGATALRRDRVGGLKRLVVIDSVPSAAALFLAFVAACFLGFSPPYNFLEASGMDAGNYEALSQHYWQAHTFFLNVSAVLAREIPISHVGVKNTWIIDPEAGKGIPLYLQGYPALLGIVKKVFAATDVSRYLNISLSIFNVFILSVLCTRFSRKYTVSGIAISLAVSTPLYFFYSKQTMSEMLALSGILVLVYSLIRAEKNGSKLFVFSAVSGLAMVQLSKLDLFFVPLFLLPTFVLLVLFRENKNCRFARFLIPLGITTVINSLVNVLICTPYYLSHFSIKKIPVSALNSMLPLPFILKDSHFIVFFSLTVCLLMSLLWIYNELSEKIRLVRLSKSAVQHSMVIFAISWFGLALFCLVVRPNLSVDIFATQNEHDRLNFVRLFNVYSPPLLLLLLLGVPLSLISMSGAARAVVLFLTLLFSYPLVVSNHSFSEIWWMRRYLASLLPLSLFTFSWLWRYAQTLSSPVFARTVGTLAMAGLFLQLWSFLPVSLRQGTYISPIAYDSVKELIQPADLILAREESRRFSGFSNFLRAGHLGVSMVAIPREKIEQVSKLFSNSRVIYLTAEPNTSPKGFTLIGQAVLEGRYGGPLLSSRNMGAPRLESQRIYVFEKPLERS